MYKKILGSILLGLLIVPTIAHAQSVFSDTYVIPVVSHTAGRNGIWMSDVTITNFQSTPLTVQLIVVESGENNSDNIFPLTTDAINNSVIVPANSTVVLKDVLNGYHGMTNISGALILGGDKPFAVTSRSYLNGANGMMLGQTVTPVRDFFENSTGRSDNTAVAIIPGISNNASTRTNIGFLAGAGSLSGATLSVQVTIRAANGTSLGTKVVSVAAGSFAQSQISVASITSTPFDIGSAEFRLVQGFGTIVPYASVIDNNTGSPWYIMGQFPASTAFAKGNTGSNLFRDLFKW